MFEAAEGIQQPRQAHHGAGDEAGCAAEEVDDERALPFPRAHADAAHVEAEAALPHGRGHRTAGCGADDVRTFEPVGIARVVDGVREDGAGERHRELRRRLDLHLRQFLDLRLQHLGRQRHGLLGRRGRRLDGAGRSSGAHGAQLTREGLQFAPEVRHFVAQQFDLAAGGGWRGCRRGETLTRSRQIGGALREGRGRGGGEARARNDEAGARVPGRTCGSGHAAIVVAALPQVASERLTIGDRVVSGRRGTCRACRPRRPRPSRRGRDRASA